jgi:hypothetical protein
VGGGARLRGGPFFAKLCSHGQQTAAGEINVMMKDWP